MTSIKQWLIRLFARPPRAFVERRKWDRRAQHPWSAWPCREAPQCDLECCGIHPDPTVPVECGPRNSGKTMRMLLSAIGFKGRRVFIHGSTFQHSVNLAAMAMRIGQDLGLKCDIRPMRPPSGLPYRSTDVFLYDHHCWPHDCEEVES